MTELKTEQEKIGEYLGRVDSFLKYYETYSKRINANLDYISEFRREFRKKSDKINDTKFEEFSGRFLSLYTQAILETF